MLSPSSLTKHLKFGRDFQLQQPRPHYSGAASAIYRKPLGIFLKYTHYLAHESSMGPLITKPSSDLMWYAVSSTWPQPTFPFSSHFSNCDQNPKLRQHQATGSPQLISTCPSFYALAHTVLSTCNALSWADSNFSLLYAATVLFLHLDASIYYSLP